MTGLIVGLLIALGGELLIRNGFNPIIDFGKAAAGELVLR